MKSGFFFFINLFEGKFESFSNRVNAFFKTSENIFRCMHLEKVKNKMSAKTKSVCPILSVQFRNTQLKLQESAMYNGRFLY